MTDTIERAVETITTDDVPGLVGTTTNPVSASTAAVAAASARRTAPLLRFLAALSSAPLTGKPWVPDLTPPTGGGEQTAEKAEFPVVGITVTGETVTPALLGAVANVSWQVYSAAGTVIDQLLREAALRQAVDYVVAQLEGGATAAADIAAGAAAVEAAGWPVDFVAGPTAGLLTADLTYLDLLGIPVFGGVPSESILVGSTAGIWCQASTADVRAAEPAIGGFEVSAFVDVVCEVAADAIASVAVAP